MSDVEELSHGDDAPKSEETAVVLNEEDKLKEEIRRFTSTVNDSSVRSHIINYSSLAKTFERASDVPEAFVKVLVKLITTSAIRRYGHAKSFQNVGRLLNALAKHDYPGAVHTLSLTIVAQFPVLPNLSESVALNSIPSSKWLFAILQQSAHDALSSDNKMAVTSALATLAFYTSASRKASQIFKRKLRIALKNATLLKMIESSSTELAKEHGDKVLCLLAVISEVSKSATQSSLFIETYSRVVLLTKVRPPQYLIDGSQPFFEFLSQSDFTDSVLPHIKKALLRSPEVAMYGVLSILERVSFSLDSCAEDLLKAALGSAQSSDEGLRDASVAVTVALSSKVSANIVAKIVNRLFDQISSAKVAETRIALLHGVASVATAQRVEDASAIDKIADDVLTRTAKADKDTHEATTSAQWAAGSVWATKLSKTTPALVGAFKEALKLPAAVRYIGFRTMVDIMEKRGLTVLPEGINAKDLLTEVDTGPKGELSSVALAFLVLNSYKKGAVEHTKAWSRVSHAESVFKEKSLSSMKWQDAVIWAKLVGAVVAQRPVIDAHAAPHYSSSILRAFSLLLFWPHWQVRRQAATALKSVLETEGAPFAEALADSIYTETVAGHVDVHLRKTPECADSHAWTVPGEWYVSTLKLLLLKSGVDLDKLAIHTLLLASVKRLVEVDGSVWIRWMHEQREAKTWEASEVFREETIQRVLKCREREVRDTALRTLIALNVESVRKDLWRHVEESIVELDVKEYNRITEKQLNIYKCPEDRLFNTDVLDFDEGEGMHNMKRENKAYSFQDQLAEIELKRELAEKRRKEGKLTARQKQVMEKELAAEKAIRVELHDLFVAAEARLDEARALVDADHSGAFARPHLLFEHCLPLTRSILVCQQAARLFLAYRDAAFEHSDDYLDQLVGSCWLRVIGSRWQVSGWKDEPLDAALKRTFGLLNERAFVGGDDDADDAMIFEDEIVGAPQLTLLYPMIKTILTNEKYGDNARNDALQLLQNAIHRKFLRDNAVLHLPMEQYASLLLEYFSHTESSSAFKALSQLIALANDTEDIGKRVQGIIREILAFVTNPRHEVRIGALEVLSAPQLLTRIVVSCGEQPIVAEVLVRIFVARHDGVESVADAATRVWELSHLHLRPNLANNFVEETVSPSALVRDSSSRALYSFVEEYPNEMPVVLAKIDEVYKDLVEVRGAVFDEVGRMQREAVDEYERRSGVGSSLLLLANIVREEEAEQLIKIVVPQGLIDRSPPCRNSLREAAVETIRRHGAVIRPTLLPFLEKLSDETPKDDDNRRQGLVVLLGTLAQYIDPNSDKVRAIVARLMEALSTPSQTVQESVSKCLSPLVPAIRSGVKDLLSKLQYLLFEGDSYGERRGAAYGMAGLIKGLGVICLKDIDLLATIQKNIADKKSVKHREGALLALEILCSTVGKLFEPYMLKALQPLLLCFGDGEENVRKAAEDTARSMMSSMSVYGTKLVLPLMLSALDDDSWRTKCAATELLGSMAFCAPRQLSSCLPDVVPKLIEVLADSSSKVQRSGEKALRGIAQVVRNPEILGVTNQLMVGLLDPANKTTAALQAVLNTKFIHYVDAPSLALMMPIIRRAFDDRVSETRRVAAQIIANIYSLTENKDMEPYLANLVPGLQRSLLDPVPEIRTVSARALGAIVSKSGGATSEKLRNDVVPWLKEKLISPLSTVDRSGAAQGLCEVLAGVGPEQLEFVMPEIISATESPDVPAETRDGYIMMYIYLPMVFNDKFVPYLPKVVPPILKSLADENEYVRTSALKAGQRLIAQFCSHARKLLLPQLQTALVDENWRIRHASVQLIGDFLFTISGVSGKSTSSTANEDDTMGMEQAGKTIVRALGQKDRDKVLAGLYLARSDVALIVRQAAGHVWKMVVTNTPRTLREVMKNLFEMVVDSLASTCEERQQMGARCLGELVRKMGDKVINEVLPVLDVNQKSDVVAQRIGVAVALHEIIANVSKEVLNHYLISIVGPVRDAVCDPDEDVRKAAADTFSVLYHVIGNEALDEIITPLLEQLTPETDHILQGLCEVMRLNSKSMLPYLLPKLTKPPVNTHALCSLAAVSGDSLSRQLPKVLDALLAACLTNDEKDPMIDSCEKVVHAVTDEEGVPVLADYLIKSAAKGNVPAAVLLRTFIEKSGVSLAYLADDVLPGLLHLYASTNLQIVDHAIQSGISLVQSLNGDEMRNALPAIKKAMNSMVAAAKGKQILGFTRPKSLVPVFTIIKDILLKQDNKALAAETFSMLVSAASEAALVPHAVGFTGPIIRVLGDRHGPNVKLPMLEAAGKVLEKSAASLRPFLPQLMSTFIKSMQDPSRAVKLASGGCLARESVILVSPDPILNELSKQFATCADEQLLEVLLVTAREVIHRTSDKVPAELAAKIRTEAEKVYASTLENPTELENSLTVCAGAVVGECVAATSDWQFAKSLLKDVESAQTKPRVRVAKSIAVQQICYSNASGLWTSEVHSACKSALTTAFTAEPNVANAAIRAVTFILNSEDTIDRELLASLVRAINHQSVEVRRVAVVALAHVAQKHKLANDLLKVIVPQLVNGTKESNSAVRCASELALIYAFKFIDDATVFDAYRATVDGIVQKNLDEVRVVLARVIRSGDVEIEPIYNIVSVP